MKKILCVLVSMILLLGALAGVGCKKEEGPEGITLSSGEISLEVGDTRQLSALVAPTTWKGEIVWTSGDAKVATVSEDGLVTAIAAGETKVTASAGEKSAICSVTVSEKVVIPLINGFKAFEKGGLLGGEGGEYYPVTAEAVGEDSVRYSGKGGLSWPDTVNNLEPDCMGGYYDEALSLDGLKIKYQLNDPMEFEGDHWYFISLADQKQLFNNWNGSDPVKTLFFMIAYEDGNIKLKPHYHDLLEMGEGWSYLGASAGVPAESICDPIVIELNKTDAGYEVYLNGELQWFDAIKSNYITVCDDLFDNDTCYLMAGAHIGNPGAQYEGEYSFTIGLDKSASSIVNVDSVAFAEQTVTVEEGNTVQTSVVITPENATNRSVTYVSNDETVAKVDENGTVTATGVGSAVIIASVQGKTAQCTVNVTAAAVSVSGIEMEVTQISLKQFEERELNVTVTPADASNKNVVWTVVDGKSNVVVTPDTADATKAILRGNHIGQCTVKATLNGLEATCEVTVSKGELNGFSQFEKGGLVNETTYNSDITMIDCGTQDRVQFKGFGGTNWGDSQSEPSTMGGIYNEEITLDGTEIYYSVDSWIDGATEHFYIIALSAESAWFSDKAEGCGTLFFLFAYNNGNVTLNAHYVGAGNGWTQIGMSAGVPATGGQYTIRLVQGENGLKVYMKNAESSEYTLQVFGETQELVIADTLFADGKAYLMGGAYAKTYQNEWAFTLGVGSFDPQEMQ